MTKKQTKLFSDLQIEFKKIEWPNRDFVVRSSLITIIMVVFFTIYIAGSDFLLSKIIFGIRN
ncbi:MAG: preprotein translocase subunit SecE [Candidatus Marinamargulisbacteria bacterium]